MLTNSVFLAANFIDAGYFPFVRKRSNADLFEQIGGQSDLVKLLPQFARDFWWILLLYILLLIGLSWAYNRIAYRKSGAYGFSQPKHWVLIIVLFILSGGLCVLGIRGGLQRVPIDIVNAGSVTKAEEVPIVLNTPFTLIKSVDHPSVEELAFYSNDVLKQEYSPLHYFKDSTFKKQNVVVIILESFAKEYTKLSGNKASLTPFLDSLMDHSLVFTNGFANGSKSIEGIPSILSSLPSLMENPFINSIYANNGQTSLASVLKPEGYTTAFFHGGINGTMNFDDWAPAAGYSLYFGKNEYKNDTDFDNYWGIWDEPFLQFTVKKMSGFKQPFHSAIFTLSSHHPYFVPTRYKNKFSKGWLENSESIGYADHALKQFFAEAAKTSWYSNTLFVLTADHSSLSGNPFYSNVVGNQCIPILFYRPGNALAAKNNRIFSQMDIMPNTLQLLGYNKPFFAFGKAAGESAGPVSYYYANGTYFIYSDSMVYQYNAGRFNSAYNYRRDSLLTTNLLGARPLNDSLMARRLKAFLQTYNHALIHNSAVVK